MKYTKDYIIENAKSLKVKQWFDDDEICNWCQGADDPTWYIQSADDYVKILADIYTDHDAAEMMFADDETPEDEIIGTFYDYCEAFAAAAKSFTEEYLLA